MRHLNSIFIYELMLFLMVCIVKYIFNIITDLENIATEIQSIIVFVCIFCYIYFLYAFVCFVCSVVVQF